MEIKPNKALPPNISLHGENFGDKSDLEIQLQEMLGKKRNSGGLSDECPFEEVLLALQKLILK